jgi:hypothetical protein
MSSGKTTRFKMGAFDVGRMGYGAMQLAGPGVFGPPKDHAAALAVLRAGAEQAESGADASTRLKDLKVFWFFFSKKNLFLTSAPPSP